MRGAHIRRCPADTLERPRRGFPRTIDANLAPQARGPGGGDGRVAAPARRHLCRGSLIEPRRRTGHYIVPCKSRHAKSMGYRTSSFRVVVAGVRSSASRCRHERLEPPHDERSARKANRECASTPCPPARPRALHASQYDPLIMCGTRIPLKFCRRHRSLRHHVTPPGVLMTSRAVLSIASTDRRGTRIQLSADAVRTLRCVPRPVHRPGSSCGLVPSACRQFTVSARARTGPPIGRAGDCKRLGSGAWSCLRSARSRHIWHASAPAPV